MKKNNKILCLLLSLIMLLGLIPATAFAAVAQHDLVAEIAYAHVGCASVEIEGVAAGTSPLLVTESVNDGESRTIIITLEHGHEIANVTVNGNRVTSYTQDPTNPNQYKLDLGAITEDTSVLVYLKGSTFKVKKEDENGDPLSGAHFVLSEINHNNPNPDITEISDRNGIAIFDNILCGEYTLYEKVAPYGYIKAEGTCTVTINPGRNPNNPITIAIDPTTTASGITINTAQAAAGSAPAAFADGAMIATFVNGKWDGDGVYHWPLGNEQDKGEHQDPDNDGICDICNHNVPVVTTTFKVLKTDDSSTTKTLGGARFVLTGTGNTSGEYTAISSLYGGIATFENIPDGTYNLCESVAPYGYVKTNETCTVTIDAKTNANNPITIAIDPTTTTASDITIAQSAVGNIPGTFANGDTIATFKNTKAETKTVELKIEKTVDGATPPAGVKFDFKIERIVGVDSNGDPIFDRAGGNHIRGVAPGETKTDSREYPVNEFGNLVISEVILNNDAGWTYDESVYKIIITTDNSGNVIKVKYSKIDTPLDQFDAAKFTNTYTEYGMDGVGHWPVGEPNDKEDHGDNNQDGICDICGFNMASPNPSPSPSPGGGNPSPSPTPGGGNPSPSPTPGGNPSPSPTPGGGNPSPSPTPGGSHTHEDKNDDNKCDDCGYNMLPVEVPKTGDDSNPLLYGVLMLLALAGIAVTTIITKRKRA